MNELIIKAVIVILLCICFSCSKDYSNACKSYCKGEIMLTQWELRCDCKKRENED